MNFTALSIRRWVASVWQTQSTKRMEKIILGALGTWGPVTAGEVSALTGYKIEETESRLDDLLERGLVQCSNGRWYPVQR
jgi:predicted HTH transcriptional regulator